MSVYRPFNPDQWMKYAAIVWLVMSSSELSRTPAGVERRTWFLVLPQVHLLDLAGPAQVFFEANQFGGRYRVGFCGLEGAVASAQGLTLSGLQGLPKVGPADRVLVPGTDSASLEELLTTPGAVPVGWLREVEAAGAVVGSICSGAYVLALAGLLDGRRCTTHWKMSEPLQRAYPQVQVQKNRLFVRDGNVLTSAGVASGVDMALWMVEEDHGPLVAARTAREMVVFLRRDPTSQQRSVYLDHRTHLHPGVHRVQDWLVAHPEAPNLEELARLAGMSERNLTRVFRQATGITLKAFMHRLKLEVASCLLRSPEMTLERVATECGFEDPRQLRRLWKREHGVPPSVWKQQQEGQLAREVSDGPPVRLRGAQPSKLSRASFSSS
jgi:transcriptional regulator GlxA family with amidase domain